MCSLCLFFIIYVFIHFVLGLKHIVDCLQYRACYFRFQSETFQTSASLGHNSHVSSSPRIKTRDLCLLFLDLFCHEIYTWI